MLHDVPALSHVDDVAKVVEAFPQLGELAKRLAPCRSPFIADFVVKEGGAWDGFYNCTFPRPAEYEPPLAYPDGQMTVRQTNVPPQTVEMAVQKADQRWLECDGTRCAIAGGSTCGPVDNLARFVTEVVAKEFEGKEHVMMLDVGCGVASVDEELRRLTGGRFRSLGVLPPAKVNEGVENFRRRGQDYVATEANRNVLMHMVLEKSRLPLPRHVFDVIYCCWCQVGTGPFLPDFPITIGNDGTNAPDDRSWGNGHGLALEIARLLVPGGYFFFDGRHEYGLSPELLRALCLSDVSNVTLEGGKRMRYLQRLHPSECSISPKIPECTPLEMAYPGILPCVWPEAGGAVVEVRTQGSFTVNELLRFIAEPTGFPTSLTHTRVMDAFAHPVVLDMVVAHMPPADTPLQYQAVSNDLTRLSQVYNRSMVGFYHEWCDHTTTQVPRSVDLAFLVSMHAYVPQDCWPKLFFEFSRLVRPGGFVVMTIGGEHLEIVNTMSDLVGWTRAATTLSSGGDSMLLFRVD